MRNKLHDFKDKIRFFIYKNFQSKGKFSFIASLKNNSTILDVGCGNHSVHYVKKICSTCKYIGIDISDYNLTQLDKSLMDEYILVEAINFSTEIEQFNQKFDAIVSSHNLEHVNDRNGTLLAMFHSLKKGGKIYLSFPSESSVNFPKRYGTLNYFDDDTHQSNPPDFNEVIDLLKKNNFEITFASKRYRPIFLFILGLLLEPWSAFKKRTIIGTWALYGFETVIHATKKK